MLGEWLGNAVKAHASMPRSAQYDAGPAALQKCLDLAMREGIDPDHQNVTRIKAVIENMAVAVS